MTGSSEILPYIKYLGDYTRDLPTYDEARQVIRVDASDSKVLRIDGAPDGIGLHIFGAGASSDRPMVNIVLGVNPQPGLTHPNPNGSAAPRFVRLEAGPHLEQAHFSLSRPIELVQFVATERQMNETRLQTGDGTTSTIAYVLEIADGNVRLGGLSQPISFIVRNATVSYEGNWHVLYLILAGRVRFNDDISSGRTIILDSKTQLDVTPPGAAFLGSVFGREEGGVQLDLHEGSSISLFHVSTDSCFDLSGANLSIEPYPETSVMPHIQSPTFKGWGQLTFAGQVDRPVFKASRDSLTLTLETKGQALEATGEIILDAKPGSVCTGDYSAPLKLLGLVGAEGAEIQQVSIYQLNIEDLPALREAERLAPWIPDRSLANVLQDAMKFGTNEPTLRANRRAHFWTRISDAVQQKNASGLIQSRARYAGARARHLAAHGLERRLLQLYSLIRYGEDVAMPLILLLVSSLAGALISVGIPALVAMDLCCERGDTLLVTVHHLILAPLGFARFLAQKRPELGLWGQTVGVLFAALNTLLLFLAAAAARRMVKAE